MLSLIYFDLLWFYWKTLGFKLKSKNCSKVLIAQKFDCVF